jgi:hypothetical protein
MTLENETMTESKVAKAVKIDYIPITVDVHPTFKGKKVASPKRCISKALRFDCMLGVPTNDEQAQALYKCNMQDIIDAGVRNMGYSERVCKNTIDEAVKAETNMYGEAFLTNLAKEFREDLVSDKARSSGTSSVKSKAAELDSLYALYGLDRKVNSFDELTQAITKKAIETATGKKK